MNPYKHFRHNYYVTRMSDDDNYFSCTEGLYSSFPPALENARYISQYTSLGPEGDRL